MQAPEGPYWERVSVSTGAREPHSTSRFGLLACAERAEQTMSTYWYDLVHVSSLLWFQVVRGGKSFWPLRP